MSLLQQIQTWKKEDAICVLIDMQTKLLPAMSDPQTVERNVIRLIQGMKALGIPTVVTQQYTKGLGPTVPAVAEALGAFEPIDKTSFSCMDEHSHSCRYRSAYLRGADRAGSDPGGLPRGAGHGLYRFP